MAKLLWMAMFLVVIQAVHSYILLTANFDDLRNIGNRLVQSPLSGQVGNIMRRAYNVFNNHLGKDRATMRADDEDIILAYHPDDGANRRKGEDSRDRSGENDKRGSNEDQPETFSALGKSASIYLQKIQRIFENA